MPERISMDPVLDIAKAYVLEKFREVQAAEDAAAAELPITQIAELILGSHESVLGEYAEKMREQLEMRRASLAVEKRSAEEQCDAGITTVDQALMLLSGQLGDDAT